MTPEPVADKLMELPEDRRAPAGMIWQCRACAKRSEDRYGIVGWSSHGYDESCMLNAALVPDTRTALNQEDRSHDQS